MFYTACRILKIICYNHHKQIANMCRYRPYIYAMHSDQPDTYGHKMGPMSTEVSRVCICDCMCTRDVWECMESTWYTQSIHQSQRYAIHIPLDFCDCCISSKHTLSDSFCMLQLNNPLRVIDRIVGHLMNGLKQMKLHRCVNIILVGDHGTDTLMDTNTHCAFISSC